MGHATLDNKVPTDEDFVPLSVATAELNHNNQALHPPAFRSFACVSYSAYVHIAYYIYTTLERVADFIMAHFGRELIC